MPVEMKSWRRRSARFIGGLALAGTGCTQPHAPDPSATVVPVTRLRAEPYSFTFYSGLVDPQRLIVRDAAGWQQVWSAIWRNQSPPPPLPNIDFAREMVAVVALGQRATGGFAILVDRAATSADGVTVLVRSIAPRPNCVVTQALTQPVDIARLPRTDGVVTFRDKAEEQACGLEGM
jgi:hypothetical protein